MVFGDPVVMVGGAVDPSFWNLLERLDGYLLQPLHLASLDQLIPEHEEVCNHAGTFMLSGRLSRHRVDGVIRELRALTEAPIIVVSEQPDVEFERRVRTAGVFFFLVIPAELDVVRQVVGSALDCFRSKIGTRVEGQI